MSSPSAAPSKGFADSAERHRGRLRGGPEAGQAFKKCTGPPLCGAPRWGPKQAVPVHRKSAQLAWAERNLDVACACPCQNAQMAHARCCSHVFTPDSPSHPASAHSLQCLFGLEQAPMRQIRAQVPSASPFSVTGVIRIAGS